MIELPEYLDECVCLLPRHQYDTAIIGYIEICGEYKVVYCFEKVIKILSETMTIDEALDYFYFNMNIPQVAYFNSIEKEH